MLSPALRRKMWHISGKKKLNCLSLFFWISKVPRMTVKSPFVLKRCECVLRIAQRTQFMLWRDLLTHQKEIHIYCILKTMPFGLLHANCFALHRKTGKRLKWRRRDEYAARMHAVVPVVHITPSQIICSTFYANAYAEKLICLSLHCDEL